MTLDDKIQRAIKLLQAIPQTAGAIEVSYSGGKDSDVILELAKMAGIPYEAIYKNTTIDPPQTIAHARAVGATVIHPAETYLQLVERVGWPSRWRRICCNVLKEYKIHDYAIQGIRRSESTKRAARYKEPEVCRVYRGGDKVRVYLPILDWTDADVEAFIKTRGIQCRPLYYDADGSFHVERRLGCIGCPLASERKMREQFAQYPRLLREIIRRISVNIETHPRSATARRGWDAYDVAFMRLFCHSSREVFDDMTRGSMFGNDIKPKDYLQNYFNIEL